MQKNKWIADRGYGTGMALAFQGDAEFIRRSINFAVNFLLSDKSQIKEQTPSFVLLNTTMENLRKAFELEGYLQKMAELLKGAENPLDILRDDDYPDDFEEQVNTFQAAMVSAKTLKQTQEALKLDPLRGLQIQETPAMVREAEAFGRKYAEEEIAKIEFEDFMRHIPNGSLGAHAVVGESDFSFGGTQPSAATGAFYYDRDKV